MKCNSHKYELRTAPQREELKQSFRNAISTCVKTLLGPQMIYDWTPDQKTCIVMVFV